MPKPSRYRGDRVERLALSTYLKLTRASETLWNRLAPGLQRHDLTPSQFGVLEALYHLGSMHQRDLGERILRSSGNMTLVIDNLEKRGLVERRRSADDRRFVSIHLTGTGSELIARVFPAHARAITDEMSALEPEEQRTLGRLCRQLGRKQDAPV
jgi:MarR family transcriptional regulator, 2-MHQ and catechol-resistance regulon repressor